MSKQKPKKFKAPVNRIEISEDSGLQVEKIGEVEARKLEDGEAPRQNEAEYEGYAFKPDDLKEVTEDHSESQRQRRKRTISSSNTSIPEKNWQRIFGKE